MLILSGIIWNLVMKDATAKKIVVFDERWRPRVPLQRTAHRGALPHLAKVPGLDPHHLAVGRGLHVLAHRDGPYERLGDRLPPQAPPGHDIVARQFHLNAREEEVFRSLEMRRGEYTEGLVLHDHHFLARVVLSPLEYWMATSHPADLKLEADPRRAQSHLPRLDLLRLLAARFPRGAAIRHGGRRGLKGNAKASTSGPTASLPGSSSRPMSSMAGAHERFVRLHRGHVVVGAFHGLRAAMSDPCSTMRRQELR